MRRALPRAAVVAALGAALLGCSNAGEDRLFSVTTTGVVKGLVYFDFDGNRAPTTGDDSVRNIRVRLVARNSLDSVASALSAVSGIYRMAGIPVGTYLVVVDTTPLSDTAVVAKLDSTEVTVKPGDSTFVSVAISYPHVSIRRARSAAIPLGRKVFVEGIALNFLGTFADTTVYVQDTSGAMRAARIRTPVVAAADSVRLRGTISVRAGQRTIEDVTVFSLGPTLLPTAQTVISGLAASAVNGTRDAYQLRVLNATVTDSATVPGGFRLTVNDNAPGSGSLEVRLDASAFPVLPPGLYVPGNKFDIVGLATPSGTAGIWRLKPRSSAEMIKLP